MLYLQCHEQSKPQKICQFCVNLQFILHWFGLFLFVYTRNVFTNERKALQGSVGGIWCNLGNFQLKWWCWISRRGHACTSEMLCASLKICMLMWYSCNPRKHNSTHRIDVTLLVAMDSSETNRFKRLFGGKKVFL